jgi:hypothetical protein
LKRDFLMNGASQVKLNHCYYARHQKLLELK